MHLSSMTLFFFFFASINPVRLVMRTFPQQLKIKYTIKWICNHAPINRNSFTIDFNQTIVIFNNPISFDFERMNKKCANFCLHCISSVSRLFQNKYCIRSILYNSFFCWWYFCFPSSLQKNHLSLDCTATK